MRKSGPVAEASRATDTAGKATGAERALRIGGRTFVGLAAFCAIVAATAFANVYKQPDALGRGIVAGIGWNLLLAAAVFTAVAVGCIVARRVMRNRRVQRAGAGVD